KKRQSRREERGLVIPNERRATPSGAFSGTTPHIDVEEGAGAIFPPTALSFAHVEQLHVAHSALLDEKIAPAGPIGFVLTGPKEPYE
ncbi:MAG: hypothetical protein AB2720_16430, partial [Candidatus Thiodiazotropha taylori]